MEIIRPKENFFQLCMRNGALPVRRMRFCCAELKEVQGAGSVTLTGVRRQESVARSKRNEAETIAVPSKRFSGTWEQFDEFTRSKEVERVQCVGGKDKIVINPIIEWTEDDVWYFLNEVARVEHCELYDKGWHRLGCLFCPMCSRMDMIRMRQSYPRYHALLMRTIRQLREGGYMREFPDLTDEDVYAWYESKKGIRKWVAENKLQQRLF